MTKDEFIAKVKIKSRLDSMENMIPNSTNPEIDLAIMQATADMNIAPPKSSLSIDQILNNDTLAMILLNGTTYYIIDTIISEWVSNGQEFNIEDLTVIDRLDRFENYRDNIKEKFDDLLAKAKTSGVFPKSSVTRQGNIGTTGNSANKRPMSPYERRIYNR